MKPTAFALLCCLLLIVACKPKQVTEKPADLQVGAAPAQACEELSRGRALHKDKLLSLSGMLENDCLVLKYSYSGGMEHAVDLYWDGQWAESIPPVAHLFVSHDAREDAFDGIKSGKKSFNLLPMRYQGLGQVIVDVHAEGVPLVRINYVYPAK